MEQKKFALAALLLLGAFCLPLYDLSQFALHSELYSHLLLIPFVSVYFFWLRRQEIAAGTGPKHAALAVALLSIGLVLVGFLLIRKFFTAPLERQDSLATSTLAFVSLFAGLCCLHFPRAILRLLAFPLGFLVFMAPFPRIVEEWLETMLQHGSAFVAYHMFLLIGTPVYRDGTFFQLPNFNMQVAPECSGIHSTLALFITSLVAGQLLLRSPRHRALLAFAVIPIALLRNGLRVTTIGELCVRIGPEMIDSFIHKRGGPVFFALSLIPFAVLLLLLLKLDRTRRDRPADPT